MPPAVSLTAVHRSFGALKAVNDITLEVDQGQIFGLLGHNGAGKTTLIRLINGLLRPDAGSIATFGLDPLVSGAEVRRRTGVLTEYPALDHFLTPRENLSVYGTIHGLNPRDAAGRIGILLDRLGLEQHAEAAAHSLSAGLKQRVALARALVHDPELLLLDEPTSNLDPMAARDVRELVREFARERGRTVLLSTHNLAEAQQLCDHIAIIRNGRLLAVGGLGELRRDITSGTVQVVTDPADIDLALGSLNGHAAAVAASPDGLALEVRLTDGEIPTMVAALAAAGVRIRAVIPHTPTLEDVYVSLHNCSSTGPDRPPVLRP